MPIHSRIVFIILAYVIYSLLVLAGAGVYVIVTRHPRHRHVAQAAGGCLTLGFVIFMWYVSAPHTWIPDFMWAYYMAGDALLHHSVDLYRTVGSHPHTQFVNMPIVAYGMVPFAFFGPWIGGLLFTGVNVLAALASLHLLVTRMRVSGWRADAIAGLFLINGPLYYSFWLGNVTPLALLALVAAWSCLEDGHEGWAGVWLACAGVLKLPLLLFGGLLVVKRRWSAFLWFLVAFVACLAASVALFGTVLHATWVRECLQPNLGHPLAAFNGQSVDGLLAPMLLKQGRLIDNWHSIVAVSFAFRLARTLVVGVLLGGTAWVGWRFKVPADPEVNRLDFSITLCLALLLSPISWTHYYLLLLLPLALIAGNQLAIPPGRGWVAVLVAAIALVSLPVVDPLTSWEHPASLLMRLVVSPYVVGGAVLLALCLAARRRLALPRS